MKAVRILMALMLIASLAGCRAKKAVIDESSAVLAIDTTKTIADSLAVTQTETATESESQTATFEITDTTKATTQTEESAVINFVDSGGTVSIDTAGNVTLFGVKSILGDFRRRQSLTKGFTHTGKETRAAAKETAKTEELTKATNTQINGITANEQKESHQQTESSTVRPRWYQTVLAKIGGLCCIAALLWLSFLYLKRKF